MANEIPSGLFSSAAARVPSCSISVDQERAESVPVAGASGSILHYFCIAMDAHLMGAQNRARAPPIHGGTTSHGFSIGGRLAGSSEVRTSFSWTHGVVKVPRHHV